MIEELPDRYFYNRNKAVKIDQILKNAFPKKSTTGKVYQKVKDAWRKVVGDEIYQSTEVIDIKKGVLYVQVESPALIHHLTNFEKYAIIFNFNNLIGSKYIEDIRFKVGNLNNGERK